MTLDKLAEAGADKGYLYLRQTITTLNGCASSALDIDFDTGIPRAEYAVQLQDIKNLVQVADDDFYGRPSSIVDHMRSTVP